MDDNIKTYIEINALCNIPIQLSPNLPICEVPTLNKLGTSLFSYLYLFSNYINEYNKKKDVLYLEIASEDKAIMDFALFLSYFTDCSNLKYENSTFKLTDETYVNAENFTVFMEMILIIHHRYGDASGYKPANSLAERMLAEAERRRNAIQAQINKSQSNQDNGSGLLEILSTLSARSNSLNVLTVKDLNYYQIMDQYKRLMMIDKYTPCLYGNATEEYIKENKVKHYSTKIINNE